MKFKIWLESMDRAKHLADEVASRIHCNAGGSCPFFAEEATKVFLKNGITDFFVVEGWVKSKLETYWRQHTWIEIEGEKIDPTFLQFSGLGEINYVKQVKKRYAPQEYLDLCAKYPDEAKYLSRFKK
jgi:hypothetical protein